VFASEHNETHQYATNRNVQRPETYETYSDKVFDILDPSLGCQKPITNDIDDVQHLIMLKRKPTTKLW